MSGDSIRSCSVAGIRDCYYGVGPFGYCFRAAVVAEMGSFSGHGCCHDCLQKFVDLLIMK